MSSQVKNAFAALCATQASPILKQQRLDAWLYDEHARRWQARGLRPCGLNTFRWLYLGAELVHSDDESESEHESSDTKTTASFKTARSRFTSLDSHFEGWLGRYLLDRFEEGYEADVSEPFETSGDLSTTGTVYTPASSISLAALHWYELPDEANVVSNGVTEAIEKWEKKFALADAGGATVEAAEDSAQPANEPEPPRPATDASPITQCLANIDSYFAEARRALLGRAEHTHSKGEWKAEMAKLDELDRREFKARKALQEHLEILYL